MGQSVRVCQLVVALALVAPPFAFGAEFPDGAAAPSAAELKQLLSDKTFDAKLANGTTWRLEYKANGYIDETERMGWLQRFFMTALPF